MHRFFVSPECINQSAVVISGKQAYQIKEVLRLQTGDRITVLDNTGSLYKVNLINITRETVMGEVVETECCPNEPTVQITLYQALLKSDKFEMVLQKGTEIGISRFVPIICERSVAKVPSNSRIERWQRILMESAEQSRRGIIPELEPPTDFRQVCKEIDGFTLMPWEQEYNKGIKAAMIDNGANRIINIIVGPEGGFSHEEVQYAQSAEVIAVTLGNRILRAETAGLVTATIVLYELGELE